MKSGGCVQHFFEIETFQFYFLQSVYAVLVESSRKKRKTNNQLKTAARLELAINRHQPTELLI